MGHFKVLCNRVAVFAGCGETTKGSRLAYKDALHIDGLNEVAEQGSLVS